MAMRRTSGPGPLARKSRSTSTCGKVSSVNSNRCSVWVKPVSKGRYLRRRRQISNKLVEKRERSVRESIPFANFLL